MACVKMYHCDINFVYPNGVPGMAQTLCYHSKDDAEAEASEVKRNMLEAGCTDIKVYTREVNAVRKEASDVCNDGL